MLRRLGVIVLWVLATVGTASITLAAVGQVGEHTTEQAAVPIDSADLRSSPAIQRLATTTTTTTAAITTVPIDPTATSITLGTTTSTSAATQTGSTSSTAAPATTTATTAASEVVWSHMNGGSIAVRVQGDAVTLVTVQVTGSGWIAEIKNQGPESVVVELENESLDLETHFQATVEHGELVVQIEED